MVNSCNKCENNKNIVTINTGRINSIENVNSDINNNNYINTIIDNDIEKKDSKICFICCKSKHNDEFIKLECCNSEEFCKSCITTWVGNNNTNKNCPKCRSKEVFHNTCRKNNIIVVNTIQYYLDQYNLPHPSLYFSSPQEMENKNNEYINNVCRDGINYLAKLYTCMCPNCLKKLCMINTIKNSEHGNSLSLDEIITIIDIMSDI